MNNRKVAIIGCGYVGAATAFSIMQSGLFSEMVLLDVDRKKAEGEAMDIMHGMPFAMPIHIHAGDYDDIADSAIIIICGPIITRQPKTIGKNKVVVPQQFFKVILSPFVKPMLAIGFLFNNKQSVEPLSTYAVTIDSIEHLTNMDFFAALPDEIENKIEAEADYFQWPN